MIRRAASLLALSAVLACAGFAAEPKRKAMPIGDQWNLSGAELEKTKMDGKRVILMTAKGNAKLKRGRNSLTGPWIMEASAEVIEADFVGKRFVIRGPFSIKKKGADGGSLEIIGTAAETTGELLFRDGELSVNGPNKVVAKDAAAAAEDESKVRAREK